MRGKSQAVLGTVLFGMLSLVVPPLSFFSSAAVALVTLRHGMREAGLVVVMATLAAGLLSMFALGNPMPAVALAVVFWLPVMGFAALLRSTISLASVFNGVLGLGLLIVLGIYLVAPVNPAQWWSGQLEQMLAPMLQAVDAQQAALLRTAFPVLAGLMTGVMVSALLLNSLLSLLLARWWQAMLYNPGGFRKEFQGLQLGKSTALVSAIALTLGWLAPGAVGGASASLLVVVLSVVLFQGMAIVHSWMAAGNRHVLWLVLFYTVMIVFMKQAVILLALLGMLDPWVDFRRRFVRADDGNQRKDE